VLHWDNKKVDHNLYSQDNKEKPMEDFILQGFAGALVAYLNNEYSAEGKFRMSGDSDEMKYFDPKGNVMLIVDLTEKKAEFLSKQENYMIDLSLHRILEYCGFVVT